jgi:alpha-tubulin suppressor-like RCC1 family protein
MFSMIIVIMAIVLVVLLALATLYFGGSAFQKDSKKLIAHTLVNQSGQIAAARQILRTEGFSLPEGQVVKLPPTALAAMPVPPRAAYAEDAGEPSESDWEYYLPTSKEHFGLKSKLNKDTCMELNRTQGFVGIPAAWDGVSRMQCFGPAEAGYTFLYELPNHSAEEHTQAIDKSVNDALPDAPTARPGYPRLCPDGTTIEAGVCSGGAPVAEPPATSAEGFWVIKASATDSAAQLQSLGFADKCPAGAIDPTGPTATPAVSLPGEKLNADGVNQLEWQIAPDYTTSHPEPLERTWCVPANKSDVPDNVVLAPDYNMGSVEDVQPSVAPPTGINYASHSYSYNRTAVITANNVTWTLLATTYGAGVENANNGDELFLAGRKAAIGKTDGVTATYFGTTPSLTLNGVTYKANSGTITFDPVEPVCIPPTPNAALGTGGDAVDIQGFGYTSVMLKKDGSVWMTGAGWDNEFGNCSSDGSLTWTRVATGVAALGRGADILMVKTDGSVWTYEYGQLKHIKVLDSGAVMAATVQGDDLAFLKSDGTLWYRGSNVYGQAGNGTADPVTSPEMIASNVASVHASGGTLYFIKKDGTLWATGYAGQGHLGQSGQISPGAGFPTTPGIRPLKLGDNVVSVDGTYSTTAFVKADGKVYVAGSSSCGMFGQTPQVNGYASFTQIGAYTGPAIAVEVNNDSIWLHGTDGTARAAGCNTAGSFGDGTSTQRTTFMPIASNVARFSGGGMTSLILDTSAQLWVAGDNSEGQYGNGTSVSSKAFQRVTY